MTHAERIDQAYPKKSACGKGIPEKMIITCTSCSTTTDIPMCLPYLHTNRLANSQWISMKNILGNIREQIQSQICVPSIVLCHTCCLKYPNTTNLKKKPRKWNYQTLCTFWKKYELSSTMHVYTVYIYICRFILWHMLWCTLILPFEVVSHHFHHLSSLPAEHLVCKAGYRWPLVASPNLAWTFRYSLSQAAIVLFRNHFRKDLGSSSNLAKILRIFLHIDEIWNSQQSPRTHIANRTCLKLHVLHHSRKKPQPGHWKPSELKVSQNSTLRGPKQNQLTYKLQLTLSWNPKQPFLNGWKWWNNIFYIKIWNHPMDVWGSRIVN